MPSVHIEIDDRKAATPITRRSLMIGIGNKGKRRQGLAHNLFTPNSVAIGPRTGVPLIAEEVRHELK